MKVSLGSNQNYSFSAELAPTETDAFLNIFLVAAKHRDELSSDSKKVLNSILAVLPPLKTVNPESWNKS